MTEEQADQQVREALEGRTGSHGPMILLARQRPVTVLPGGRSRRRRKNPESDEVALVKARAQGSDVDTLLIVTRDQLRPERGQYQRS